MPADGPILERLGVRSFPQTIVIDAGGVVCMCAATMAAFWANTSGGSSWTPKRSKQLACRLDLALDGADGGLAVDLQPRELSKAP